MHVTEKKRKKNYRFPKAKTPQNRLSSGKQSITASYFSTHSSKEQGRKELISFYLLLMHAIPKQKEGKRKPNNGRVPEDEPSAHPTSGKAQVKRRKKFAIT